MNKDFLKLAKEPGDSERFFIGLLSSSDENTITSINRKITEKESVLESNTEFIYYSLDHANMGPQVLSVKNFLK